MALIDFTLSNARRFYSSMGNNLEWKRLSEYCLFPFLFKSLKQGKMFHDETMPSFFRRPSYSPDGSLLIVPGEVTMVELFLFLLHWYNN